MMIIRLTQKLARKIKVDLTSTVPRAENPFADWTANLFTVGRTQYILLTHTTSLYSVVFTGRGLNALDSFVDHALTAMREQMKTAGFGDLFERNIAPLTREIRFSKTGDRSVMGSMNDLVQHAKMILSDDSPAGTATKLNKIPMGALHFQYPRDALADLAGKAGAGQTGHGNLLLFPGMEAGGQGLTDPLRKAAKPAGAKPGEGQEPQESKTPAQKRAATQQFQKEMLAMFEQFRQPASQAQRLNAAQELIYAAWEASPARAVKLARQALELSPDCADAYVLLAELTAGTIRERIELLRQGVAVGRRALGTRYFREHAGHFWLEVDSRPFMRAMAALAGILWEIGQGEEAIDIWDEMLHLNPNDNQGVRYLLLGCLLELNRDREADHLLQCFAEDASAEWSFGMALLAFRTGGDTPDACRKLSTAHQRNSHVLPYLLGTKKLPKRLPEYVSFGDETEAVSYVAGNLAGWAKTPGALAWLKDWQQRNTP